MNSGTLVVNFTTIGKRKMTPSSVFCLYCASPLFCKECYEYSTINIIKVRRGYQTGIITNESTYFYARHIFDWICRYIPEVNIPSFMHNSETCLAGKRWQLPFVDFVFYVSIKRSFIFSFYHIFKTKQILKCINGNPADSLTFPVNGHPFD